MWWVHNSHPFEVMSHWHILCIPHCGGKKLLYREVVLGGEHKLILLGVVSSIADQENLDEMVSIQITTSIIYCNHN